MESMQREEWCDRVDAAVVTYLLEKGRQPQFIRMSYATFEAQWGGAVKRETSTGMWMWRGIPVLLRALPPGEVECV